MFGKIKKWFADLKNIAFTGNYSDLLNVPEIVNNRTTTKEGTVESTATMFGKIKKWFADLKNIAFTGNYSDLLNVPEIVNNRTTTKEGTVLDGRQGKAIQDEFDKLNTNMIYRPFVFDKWCDGSEQVNLLIDVSKSEKRRLPIFIGGNVGSANFLQMGLLDNLTSTSTEINFKEVLPLGSGTMRAYANLHNGNANMYRILIQSASGMGQHIFVMIPVANIRFENVW